MVDLIILAMGDSRWECPYDAEVWGVNTGYRQIMQYNHYRDIAPQEIKSLEALLLQPEDADEHFATQFSLDRFKELLTAPAGRIDKIFICHKGQEWDAMGDPVFNFDELNNLTSQGVEIVSLFKVKELNKITRIPYRTIVRKFGTEYFSDSIAYMLAYALHLNTRRVWNRKLGKSLLRLKEPMRIRMYGVDMHTQDEYATERGGIEYFIAIAKTLGVDFWLHPNSAVCRTTTGRPYGFVSYKVEDYDPQHILKLQGSISGLMKLVQMGKITPEQFNKMREKLDAISEKSNTE